MLGRAAVILKGQTVQNGKPVFFPYSRAFKKFWDKRIAVEIVIFIWIVDSAKIVFHPCGYSGQAVVFQNGKTDG